MLSFIASPSAYPNFTRQIYTSCPVCCGASFEEAKQLNNLELCNTHKTIETKLRIILWLKMEQKYFDIIEERDAIYDAYERRCRGQLGAREQ